MKKKKLPASDPRSVTEIVDRLRWGLGCQTDADLERRLSRPRDHLSKWRANDSRPYGICVEVSEDTDLQLDWLLTGRGPQRRAERGEKRASREECGDADWIADTTEPYDLAGAEARLDGFRGWLEEWWQDVGLDER